MKQERVLDTENNLAVKVTGENRETLVNEKCCTAITITLNNMGEIATSFLGALDEDILGHLEKATNTYFKAMKRDMNLAEEDEDSQKLHFEDMHCDENGCRIDHHDHECKCGGYCDEDCDCDCDECCEEDCGCDDNCDEYCYCACHDDKKKQNKKVFEKSDIEKEFERKTSEMISGFPFGRKKR